MKLKLESKIIGGFLLLSILVGTIGYFNFTNIQRIADSFDALDNYHKPAYDSLNVMRSEALTIFSSSLKFDFFRGEAEPTAETKEKMVRELTLISDSRQRFSGAFGNYTALATKYASTDEKKFVKIIGKKWEVFSGASDDLIRLRQNGAPAKDILEAKNSMQDAEDALISTLNDVSAYEERLITEKKNAADTIVRNTLISTILVLAITIIASLGSGLLISDSIVDPITQLRAATDEVAKGNLNAKIDIKSGDEIEELANSFNDMVWDLRNSKETLESRAQRLEEYKQELEANLGELQKASKMSVKEMKVSELKKRMNEIKDELKKYEEEKE